MMKQRCLNVLFFLIRCLLRLRYRYTVKGLKEIVESPLAKKGGLIFLPNHPTVFVDPGLLAAILYPRFSIRPIIVEYMYFATGIHPLVKLVNAIPMPSMATGSNSFKRLRCNQAIQKIIQGIERHENFLFYPAGKVKINSYEQLSGSSGLHTILSQTSGATVVLVRTKGFWGSFFSNYPTVTNREFFPSLLFVVKTMLQNLLFFSPRRSIEIEFQIAPPDFPRNGDRTTLNSYLEEWYNRNPDGSYGESPNLVPHLFWSAELPPPPPPPLATAPDMIHLEISPEIHDHIVEMIAKLAKRDSSTINLQDDLRNDLGLDSLDLGELASFLEYHYGVKNLSAEEAKTVHHLLYHAQLGGLHEEATESLLIDEKKWHLHNEENSLASIPPSETIPEAFLKSLHLHRHRAMIADGRSGILTFQEIALRVFLLAKFLGTLPGKRIGIMLPASVGVTVVLFACFFAKKVPVMLNWTMGSRHLESVVEQTGIEKVLSSWSFLDRLSNVELGKVEQLLFLLEDLRDLLSLTDKASALIDSRKSVDALLDKFDLKTITKEDVAVLLFTSGTENLPKGVPLTHQNLLANQRGCLERLNVYKSDSLLWFLPPFHSFGLTIGALMPLLAGFRCIASADPTNSSQLAQDLKQWKASVICGAPTFLKGLLQQSDAMISASVRLIVSGAEKAPRSLMELAKEINLDDKFIEGYGITECSPVLTVGRPHHSPQGVGQPLYNVELIIVDPDTLEPTQEGEDGLILARGESVFQGYLNRELASPFVKVGQKSWYVTGDIGHFDDRGNLHLTDRLKRFVKIGGEMISLSSIENTLLEQATTMQWSLNPDGPSLALIPMGESDHKASLYLFTTFKTTLEEVNGVLKKSGFTNLARITHLRQIEAIPLMGSGKIFYRQLQDEAGK